MWAQNRRASAKSLLTSEAKLLSVPPLCEVSRSLETALSHMDRANRAEPCSQADLRGFEQVRAPLLTFPQLKSSVTENSGCSPQKCLTHTQEPPLAPVDGLVESNGARLLLTLQVNVILLRRALSKCIYLVIAWVDLCISQLVYAKKEKIPEIFNI